MTNRIRELREAAGLRQIDVAEATGIDQRTLSNYETGKTNPDSYALIKLADYFGVSIDYILMHRACAAPNTDELRAELLRVANEMILAAEKIRRAF